MYCNNDVPVIYTEADLKVFALIHAGTRAGRSYDDIRTTLDDDLGQTTVNFEPEQVADTSQNAIVPLSQFLAVAGKLAATAGTLEAVEAERDRLIEELQAERQARLDAERRAAHADGQLEATRRQAPGWLARLFRRGDEGRQY